MPEPGPVALPFSAHMFWEHGIDMCAVFPQFPEQLINAGKVAPFFLLDIEGSDNGAEMFGFAHPLQALDAWTAVGLFAFAASDVVSDALGLLPAEPHGG